MRTSFEAHYDYMPEASFNAIILVSLSIKRRNSGMVFHAATNNGREQPDRPVGVEKNNELTASWRVFFDMSIFLEGWGFGKRAFQSGNILSSYFLNITYRLWGERIHCGNSFWSLYHLNLMQKIFNVTHYYGFPLFFWKFGRGYLMFEWSRSLG